MMMWKLDSSALGKAFYWFGLANGIMAFFAQYGFVYQVGTQQLFADPVFHLLMGNLGILAGIYLNTEKRMM